MGRKEIYSQIEKLEGGEVILKELKAKFQEDDDKLQKEIDINKTLKTEFGDLQTSMEELKATTKDTVPKTELEKQMTTMQKTLEAITTERDDEREKNEAVVAEKKQNDLQKHFFDMVAEPYGAVGASDAVAVSASKMGYDEEGNMSYGGKVGDEAGEQFKVDTSRFMQNNGHNTQSGNAAPQNDFVADLREQMLRD